MHVHLENEIVQPTKPENNSYIIFIRKRNKASNGLTIFLESLILAQDERWRRA